MEVFDDTFDILDRFFTGPSPRFDQGIDGVEIFDPELAGLGDDDQVAFFALECRREMSIVRSKVDR